MPQPKPAPVAPSRKAPRTLAGVVIAPPSENRQLMLKSYEAAIRLLQTGDYEKAHAAFHAMLDAGPGDLAERIRMYCATCLSQIARRNLSFETPEEQYDYAISLLNDGHHEDARDQLAELSKKHPQADYAFYGLAVLASLTGDSHACLEHLTEAIRLNAQNRIQARADGDFRDMADDPRFTELLYPEV